MTDKQHSEKNGRTGGKTVWCGCAVGMTIDNRLVSVVSIQCGVDIVSTLCRGGFKVESLLGHITRKASSPLRSPPSPPSHPVPFSLPSTPLEVGPLKSS